MILGEANPLESWGSIDTAVSSELVRLECLRTIDRARVRLGLADDETSRQRAAVLEVIQAVDLVPLATSVLDRAAEPFPTLLGSLDAMHLATALLVRDRYSELRFATHDTALAIAARAVGFPVDGA